MKNELPDKYTKLDFEYAENSSVEILMHDTNIFVDYLAELTEENNEMKALVKKLTERVDAMENREKTCKVFGMFPYMREKTVSTTSPSQEPLHDEFDDVRDIYINIRTSFIDGTCTVYISQGLESYKKAKKIKAYLEHLIEQDKERWK